MNSRTILFLGILCAIILFTQCSDLFETDIKNRKITIIAPSDKMQTKIKDILFVWEGHPDIKQYNIQVVTPGYYLIQNVVADTTLKGTKFLLKNIAAGEYNFRIVGYNGKSRCYSDTLRFKITDANPVTNSIENEK